MDSLSSVLPDVSRETLDRLETYLQLLRKWNPRINLVAKSTLAGAALRHFADSAQVLDQAPPFRTWVDLGTGGGFPGMVVSMMARDRFPDAEFTLIDSDTRKCAFLRNVSRETSHPVTVLNGRIEDLGDQSFDVVSARALAPLPRLLGYAQNYLSGSGVCLFLKGESYGTEIEEARKDWTFTLDTYPSQSSQSGAVLRIQGVRHRAI